MKIKLKAWSVTVALDKTGESSSPMTSHWQYHQSHDSVTCQTVAQGWQDNRKSSPPMATETVINPSLAPCFSITTCYRNVHYLKLFQQISIIQRIVLLVCLMYRGSSRLCLQEVDHNYCNANPPCVLCMSCFHTHCGQHVYCYVHRVMFYCGGSWVVTLCAYC